MSVEESYARLLGRQPSAHEREQLLRVRDALNLESNDAMWLVIMALQHYQTLYERIPKQIEKASKDASRRPFRPSWKALTALTAAIVYAFSYTIHSGESGYAKGYNDGYNAAYAASIELIPSGHLSPATLPRSQHGPTPQASAQPSTRARKSERGGQ